MKRWSLTSSIGQAGVKGHNGNVRPITAGRSLARGAAQALELDEAKRKRAIIRMDAGGGSVDEVNWPLSHDYQLHCKDFSSARAKTLAATVTDELKMRQIVFALPRIARRQATTLG
jgi:hypothetical protein